MNRLFIWWSNAGMFITGVFVGLASAVVLWYAYASIRFAFPVM
jgi:hypothetical protein